MSFALALPALLAGVSFAQTSSAVTVVEPPVPLLPVTATLLQATPGQPVPDDDESLRAILKEDGLLRQESRVALAPGQSRPGQSGPGQSGPGQSGPGGWIKAYEFSDATGAFAAFTYLRQGGRAAGSRAGRSEVVLPEGERVILSGTSVLRARLAAGQAGSLLAEVETGLPKIGGRKALAPLLPTLLPQSAVDIAAARYALGPAGYQAEGGILPAVDLGWDKSLEVITAPVESRGGHGAARGTLTLLLYPTPQIAGERGRAIEKMVNEGGPAKFGTVKLRRVGPLVGMASGGLSAEQAEALVAGLSLHQEVTFDQKMPLEFHAEVRKTASLLQNIAVLSGVLILAALLLGLFLGGARAGIRVLMGKPAASEPEFLTINLREPPRKLLPQEDAQDRLAP